MYWDTNYFVSSYYTPDYWDGESSDIILPRKMSGMSGVGITMQRRPWGTWRKPRR
jgi:hypothetical protein